MKKEKIKEISIQVITEDNEFGMIFIKPSKIVEILGDKKTLMSDFIKELIVDINEH